MMVKLARNRAISEVLQEFNTEYPFLRLDFYKYFEGRLGTPVRQKLPLSKTLAAAGLRKEGEIEIYDAMTVRQLEQHFLGQFGLAVQVSRRSGTIWLTVSFSDHWTLKQQNEHGKELSSLEANNQ